MRKLKLHWWILIGMAIGAVLGAIVHAHHPPDLVQTTWVYETFDGVARLFLNLLEMIVVPLIFFSLVSGMLSMGDVARLGRLGIKTLVLYMLTSMLAIGLGLVLVNAIRPGVGVDLAIPTEIVETEVPTSGWDVLIGMLPGNIVEAAADFELLALIVFALLFGAAMLSLKGPRRDVLFGFVEAGAEVMMGVTRYILYLAPIGIAALIARMVSTAGLKMFIDMKWYIVTVFLALAAHALITLPLLIYAVTRLKPYRYYRAISTALLTGFSTASSNATLPVTLEQVEDSGGVSNRIASFVLPLGATINLDGTALYEIVSVLFIAQLHASVDPSFVLTFGQQLLIVFLGLAVSIGAAGIPHAGLVMMVIILQAVGLPLEYTGLIWAVDRILDMCRTSVNITSDASISLIVADTEGELDRSVLWP